MTNRTDDQERIHRAPLMAVTCRCRSRGRSRPKSSSIRTVPVMAAERPPAPGLRSSAARRDLRRGEGHGQATPEHSLSASRWGARGVSGGAARRPSCISAGSRLLHPLQQRRAGRSPRAPDRRHHAGGPWPAQGRPCFHHHDCRLAGSQRSTEAVSAFISPFQSPTASSTSRRRSADAAARAWARAHALLLGWRRPRRAGQRCRPAPPARPPRSTWTSITSRGGAGDLRHDGRLAGAPGG